MPKLMNRKTLLIIVVVVLFSGCTKKQEVPEDSNLTTRIFDYSGDLIAEIDDSHFIPNEYNSYITRALKQVSTKTKLNPYDGLDIYTNLDIGVQDALNSSIDPNYNSAVLVTENKNGNIIASYNSNYKDELNSTETSANETSMLEHSFSNVSTFSPLFSFPLAFEYLSTSTADYVLDSPFEYVGTGLTAENSDGNHFGAIPLQQSFNETRVSNLWLADAVIKELGFDQIKTYLSSFSDDAVFIEDVNVQFAMNGTSLNLTTIANGYQMILNAGAYKESSYVSKIVFRKTGIETILSFKQANSISSEAAYLTDELLKNSFKGLSFFDVIESQNRDYELYGFAGDLEENIQSQTGKTHLFSSVLGNTNYSIASFTRYAFDNNSNEVESNIQTLHSRILDQLESLKELDKSIPIPTGLIETDYLPGTLNDFGIDAHLPNNTNTPHIGYSKP